MALKALGQETSEILQLTSLPHHTIRNIIQKARDCRFNPAARPIKIKDAYIEDAIRTGRPSKVNTIITLAIKKVPLDYYRREKSTVILTKEITKEDIATSVHIVHRELQKKGFHKTKVVKQPGLSAKMK